VHSTARTNRNFSFLAQIPFSLGLNISLLLFLAMSKSESDWITTLAPREFWCSLCAVTLSGTREKNVAEHLAGGPHTMNVLMVRKTTAGHGPKAPQPRAEVKEEETATTSDGDAAEILSGAIVNVLVDNAEHWMDLSDLTREVQLKFEAGTHTKVEVVEALNKLVKRDPGWIEEQYPKGRREVRLATVAVMITKDKATTLVPAGTSPGANGVWQWLRSNPPSASCAPSSASTSALAPSAPATTPTNPLVGTSPDADAARQWLPNPPSAIHVPVSASTSALAPSASVTTPTNPLVGTYLDAHAAQQWLSSDPPSAIRVPVSASTSALAPAASAAVAVPRAATPALAAGVATLEKWQSDLAQTDRLRVDKVLMAHVPIMLDMIGKASEQHLASLHQWWFDSNTCNVRKGGNSFRIQAAILLVHPQETSLAQLGDEWKVVRLNIVQFVAERLGIQQDDPDWEKTLLRLPSSIRRFGAQYVCSACPGTKNLGVRLREASQHTHSS
jgi:hypothetical protein